MVLLPLFLLLATSLAARMTEPFVRRDVREQGRSTIEILFTDP